jgi:hypothetical protein
VLAESVALVFATRPADEEHDLGGLPELGIGTLGDADARALLAEALSGPLDGAVRDAIVAETGGNPLGLLELPRSLTPAELAGGFGLLDALPVGTRLEVMFRRRFEALPDEAQRLVLVAAAEPTGDAALLWRAAGELGIGFDAAGPAAADGLLEVGTRVTFRHPVVRSAIYRAASDEDRRSVHLALAEATDPELDPDRRAWHRAQATRGPDAQVADELERSADEAQARGGVAAAAAFLERAAALTLDPAARATRLLAAAQAKRHAGAPDAAAALLSAAEAGPLDELQRVRGDLLRAQLAFHSGGGRGAARVMLAAANHLAPLAPEPARNTYLDAFATTMFVGRASDVGVSEVARASAPRPRLTGSRSSRRLPRDRLGTGDGGTVPCAAEHGRACRGVLPRRRRSPRTDAHADGARPRPPALRRVAAPRGTARRRAPPPGLRLRDAHCDGRRRIRRTGPP